MFVCLFVYSFDRDSEDNHSYRFATDVMHIEFTANVYSELQASIGLFHNVEQYEIYIDDKDHTIRFNNYCYMIWSIHLLTHSISYTTLFMMTTLLFLVVNILKSKRDFISEFQRFFLF